MNFIFNKNDKEIKNLEKTFECYLVFCADVYKDYLNNNNKYINNRYNIISKYISNELTKKEFIDKMNLLDKSHFNSNYYKKFANCVINNCYEKCKKNLDDYLLKTPDIKYKKPPAYTVNDFIYIMKNFYYYNVTIKIAKSKSIKNLLKLNEIIYSK